MEKPLKQRNKILAFLPKAASAVTFQVSPPISPAGKGSPGPIVSLIPKEAPRKSKTGSFDAWEPASPKVSCMGQIKRKKEKKETVRLSKPKLASQAFTDEVKRKPLVFVMHKVLKGTKRDHKSDVSKAKVAERVPSLGQMKQFSSARGTLSDFDWRAYDAAGGTGPVSNPLYEENGVKSEKEEEIVVNGVGIAEETRKENLWKRRTTAP
ncbi:uncharacterized protein At1g76070-like [Durio zibethinus]|uniref:Uncharacterized protein At1g76070-like n=1 Tax=Durio zibethinus TaxID=66656 RepID=A0A6P6BAA4_DURZI|nr:uncharacterized protein At1g76070-like [Durio zibethinus]